MRRTSDFIHLTNSCVELRSYTKLNLGIVILGRHIYLFDFTHNRTLFGHDTDNQGMEHFTNKLYLLKEAIHFCWSFQVHGNCKNFDKLKSSTELLQSYFGYIPKFI